MAELRSGHIMVAGIALMLLTVSLSCLGFLLWTADVAEAAGIGPNEGEWVIDEHVTLGSNTMVYGNITIVSGGVLEVRDSVLSMVSRSDGAGALSIVITGGGKLVLNNSVLQAYLYSFESMPVLAVLVENGGELIMESSTMRFAGHLLIDNGRLEMHSSVIEGIDSSLMGGIINVTAFPTNIFRHSPVLTAFSSEVVMVESSIKDIFSGDKSPQGYVFDYPFVSDDLSRSTVSYTLNRYPAASSQGSVNDVHHVGSEFIVPGGENVSFDGFDVAGLLFNADDYDLKLHIEYRTATKEFSEAVQVMYGRDGSLSATGITLSNTWTVDDKNPLRTLSADITDFSCVDLSSMQVFINNTDTEDLLVERLWVTVEGIEIDAYRNITMAGDSTLVAVASELPINYFDNPLVHNALVLMDASEAHLYGVNMSKDYTDYPFAPAIITVDRTVTVKPLNKTSNDTTEEDLAALMASGDTPYYVVDAGEQLAVVMNLTGLPESKGIVKMIANTKGGVFSSGPAIQYYYNGLKNTTIIPEENPTVQSYIVGKFNASETSKIEIFYNNTVGSIVNFDYLYLELTYTPQAFIYKFADINVKNTLNDPVSNATVEALNIYGEKAVYYDSGVASELPGDIVISYLGRLVEDFNITDNEGNVLLPLLVNIVEGGSIKSYAWTLNVMSASGGYLVAQSNVSFSSYPFILPSLQDDNFKSVTIVGSAPSLRFSEPYQFYNATGTYLAVKVTNVGDSVAADFSLDFLVNGISIGIVGPSTLSQGASEVFEVLYEQESPGPLVLRTTIISDDGIINGSSTELNMTVNLAVEDFIVYPSGDTLRYNNQVTFYYIISNKGVYNASNVTVSIACFEDGVESHFASFPYQFVIGSVPAGEQTSEFQVIHNLFRSPGDLLSSEIEFRIAVNENKDIPESNYDDNQKSKVYNYVDDRIDLVIESLSISDENPPIGKTVDIEFSIHNTGLRKAENVRLTIYMGDGEPIVNTTKTAYGTVITVEPKGWFNGTVKWKLAGDVGEETLVAYVNEFRTLEERDYSNNSASIDIAIAPAEAKLTLSVVPSLSVSSGETFTISGYLRNYYDETPLGEETVLVEIYDDNNVIRSLSTVTNSNGFYYIQITAADDMSGSISVKATALGSSSTPIQLIVIPTTAATDQPLWVWVLVAVAIISVIAVFSLYVYRYSMGRMVECGECHALIPESARSCPNCGTDFEVGTAKCSECSSWIPVSSTHCPECGASFVGKVVTDEKENEYIRNKRKDYEVFVDSYREIARKDLGKKYSDSKFLSWWKQHPDYISFEDWLYRDEEKKTEKTVPCPSCGTPNVSGSKNCFRCGQPLHVEEVAGRVVRRERAEGEPESRRKKVVIKKKAPTVKSEAEKAKEETEEGPFRDEKG
ncbi:MAG: hypothetical protein PWQ62_186 [Candidatus Methanomethylophilaceae archaeon]|nr:hypothetical protein [Candidatus Methanomethylophilaceae archaeon]